MNYFGHVALACQFSQSAEFLLGSALPDFASILGCRVPSCSHSIVASGLRFHHMSDEVFHDLADFKRLVRNELGVLREHGVRKGPARALAHIGLELLLDAELTDDNTRQVAFRDAITAGAPNRLGRLLVWSSSDHPRRFERLRLRLVERLHAIDNFGADQIAERLIRTLSKRPRLRLSDQEQSMIARWVGSLQIRLGNAWEPLWLDLVRRVSSQWSE